MGRIAIGRGATAAAAVAVALLMLGAADPGAPDRPAIEPALPGTAPRLTPSNDPPAGQLLIAAAGMQDPRFAHSVILIVQHDRTGAFGIIVNHPVGKQPVKELLEAIGDKDDDAEGTIEVLSGGPVEPQFGFVVHSGEYRRAETLDIDGKVAMTASKQTLHDIGHRKGPKQYVFAFGYAGWGAGQLEGEMARQDWFTAPEDAALLFDGERSSIWKRAVDRRGQEL